MEESPQPNRIAPAGRKNPAGAYAKPKAAKIPPTLAEMVEYTGFMKNIVTYPHDRFLARTVLPWIPHSVLPNHLTIARLLLTPFVAVFVYLEWFGIAIPFFLLVASTDALDGSLARTRNCVTPWGMVWDPVADKLLIGSVAVLLLFSHFPEELAVAIFALEAMFLAGAYYRKRQGLIVSANIWGKIKMFLQVVGVTLYMYSLEYDMPALAILSYAVLIVATGFAVVSLFKHGA
jgi:CDP-diacylglycerol--glycerol-3-phosphate 3-phosphatidyltransferase